MTTKPKTSHHDGRRAACSLAAATLIIGALGNTPLAHAYQSSPGTGNIIIPESLVPFHHSFVRNGVTRGGVTRAIVARDFEYSADIKSVLDTETNFTIVDILMCQCYGGGFLDDIQRDILFPHTFASASLWSEVARFDFPGNNPKTFRLDEFARPWRQDAAENAWSGMLQHFTAGAVGINIPPPTPNNFNGFNFPILKDPYARTPAFWPFVLGFPLETPQYESPDAAPGGANDLRDIGTNNVGTNNQYAILAIWDVGVVSSGISVARMYNTLLDLGVPEGNIAVIGPFDGNAPAFRPSVNPTNHPDGNVAYPIGPFRPIGPTDLGGIATSPIVDGDNTRASWLKALAGGYFTTPPKQGSQIFIYNEGHGQHLIRLPFGFEWQWNWKSNPGFPPWNWTNIWRFQRIYTTNVMSGTNMYTNSFEFFPSDIVPGLTTGSDANDFVRLYFAPPFAQSLLSGASLMINGQSFPLMVDTNTLPLDPEVITSNTVPYVVSVPHSLWAVDANVTIQLTGLTYDSNSPPSDPSVLLAGDLEGGVQEFLAINTTTNTPPPPPPTISFNTNGLGWTLNGSTNNGPATIVSNTLTLTVNAGITARSAWYDYPQYIGSFQAGFVYADTLGGGADGMAFVLQNDPRGTSALGAAGSSLGVSGITPSAELEFNIYLGNTPGYAFQSNGATGSYLSTAPVAIDNSDPIYVNIYYDGTTLHLSLADSNAATTFTTNLVVGSLPAVLGTNMAWIGFTGADGGLPSEQVVSNFFYIPIPSLFVQSGGNSVLLSWLAGVSGYSLQSATDLLTGTWANVTNSIMVTNGFNEVLVSPAVGNNYYRLTLPTSGSQ